MSEYHVASFIVRCHPQCLAEVAAQIGIVNGAEVHGQDAKGTLIVTVEGCGHHDIADRAESIREISNVVDLASVYHEYAPATEEGEFHDTRS